MRENKSGIAFLAVAAVTMIVLQGAVAIRARRVVEREMREDMGR